MSNQPEISSAQKLPFQFTGNGFEYFRIWIVNVLLTIITLGIYSAWAKVRTKRYFYRNTKVDGSSFEYHARPTQILKGRLLIFGGYVIFVAAAQFQPVIGGIIAIIFVLAMPWLIVRSHVFTARNSSWRNIRFDFNEHSLKDAIWTFLIVPILIPFTLGIIIPYLSYRGWRFSVTNSRVGRQQFSFQSVRVGAYYRAFFTMVFLLVVIVLAFSGLIAVSDTLFRMQDLDPRSGTSLLSLVPLLIILFMYLIVVPGYRVMTRNISLNGATLGDHTFESTLKVRTVLWIYISNAVAIVFSIGLFTPWARVRVSRYLAKHLVLNAADDLESFVQAEQRKASAFGEEATDFMEVDIGGI
jgi:uncharacterized membrane protein YjgN (DUF898 family)|tara:strand:- start:341 stop:1405 length:1065 start_codon:yes stop_codon:yes gene_type:complete